MLINKINLALMCKEAMTDTHKKQIESAVLCKDCKL